MVATWRIAEKLLGALGGLLADVAHQNGGIVYGAARASHDGVARVAHDPVLTLRSRERESHGRARGERRDPERQRPLVQGRVDRALDAAHLGAGMLVGGMTRPVPGVGD